MSRQNRINTNDRRLLEFENRDKFITQAISLCINCYSKNIRTELKNTKQKLCEKCLKSND